MLNRHRRFMMVSFATLTAFMLATGCSVPFFKAKPAPEPAPKDKEAPPATATPAEVVGVVTADVLNIRDTPSLSGSITGKAKRFDVLVIRERKDGWYSVEYGDGKKGWAWSYYVMAKEPSGELTYPFLSITVRGRKKDEFHGRTDPGDWAKPAAQVSPAALIKIPSQSTGVLIETKEMPWKFAPVKAATGQSAAPPIVIETNITFGRLGLSSGKTAWLPLGVSLDQRRFFWQDPPAVPPAEADMVALYTYVDSPSAVASPPPDAEWEALSQRFAERVIQP